MIIRKTLSHIYQSLARFPAVLLVGARQNGKSTVAKQLVAKGYLDHYISLDDFNYLAQAKSDPDGFVAQFAHQRIALDEIQRVPELMRALKKQIDANKQKGQFFLTGSANVLAYPNVSESLAGRMAILKLEGLSLSELLRQSQPSDFLKLCFSDLSKSKNLAQYHEKLKTLPKITKEKLYSLMFYGGYPELALTAECQFSKTWFDSYLMSYIERDVRDLSQLLNVVSFGKCFKLLGTRTGNLLNIKNISNDVGLDQRLVSRYIEMMSMTFQMTLLQPWFANVRKQLVKSPKCYLNDSGAACQLWVIDNATQLQQHPYLGSIFETWVFAELRKLLALEVGIQIYFYRTHVGKEVDFILQKGDQYCAVEVKFSDKVSWQDFSGIVDFQKTLGKPVNGVVLYTGESILTFPNHCIALPISLLA